METVTCTIAISTEHYLRIERISRMLFVDADNLGFALKNWAENGLQFHGKILGARPLSMAIQISQLACSYIERCLTFLVVLSRPEIRDDQLSHALRKLYDQVPDTLLIERENGRQIEISLKAKLKAAHLGIKESPKDLLNLHSVNLRYETKAAYEVRIIRKELREMLDTLDYFITSLLVNYQSFLGDKGRAEYREIEDKGHYVSTWFAKVSDNILADIRGADSFIIKSEPFS